MHVRCGFLAWLLLTLPASAADYALVIGVNHCPQFVLPDGSKPKPLGAAESDADSMARLLIDKYGFPESNLRIMKGEQATLAAVRASFQHYNSVLRNGDRFVFYFSGHGTQIPDQKPFDEDDDLDEALCVYDARSSGEKLLVDDELGRWLEDLPASSVTIFLDCCHAGTGHKELDADIQSRYLPCRVAGDVKSQTQPWSDLRGQQKSINRVTAAFFACQPGEQAYERRMPGGTGKQTIRAGQFTHFLRRGLETDQADLNKDGRITQEELARYVESNLNETFNKSRRVAADQQHPTLESVRPELSILFVKD